MSDEKYKENDKNEIDLTAEQTIGALCVSEKPQEKDVPMVWRVFGGAVFSIIFLLAVTIFGYIINQVNNVQTSVQTLSGEMFRKTDYEQRSLSVWNILKTVEPMQSRLVVVEQKTLSIDGIKERQNANDLQIKNLEQQNKSLAEENKALSKDVQSLRERLIALESKK